MFDTYPDFNSPLAALRGYVEEQREGLLNAAELLGGPDGLRRAQTVIDGLGQPNVPTEWTLTACRELLDLLMLEHVHDPARIEAERFALIDPGWPIVADICLLADGFQDALEACLDDASQQQTEVAA